jgi:hypothetical protein
MANTFAPNGFQQFQGTGTTPSFEQTLLAIASGNTTPIFSGDPVIQATGATGVGTGYITQASAPAVLAITNVVVTAGVATITFTATTAPAVGSTIVITGLATTNSPLNGAFTVISSTTTTVTFNVPFQTIATNAVTVSGYVFIPVAGIFVGCKYLSISQKRTTWSSYWPGSDANGDVFAYVITDPNAQFLVQTANSNTTATAVGIAAVGQNIGFNYNDFTTIGETNGNTATGQSTYFADQYTLAANYPAGYASAAALPFRVVSLLNYQPGATSPLVSVNGSDATTAYNKIVVGFNYAMPNRPGAGI